MIQVKTICIAQTYQYLHAFAADEKMYESKKKKKKKWA